MSQKYQCADCGHIFDEPVFVHDDPSPTGVSLPPEDYTYAHCPICGGDNLDKVQPCKVPDCGGYALYLEALCGDCQMRIWNKCYDLILGFLREGFHKEDVEDVMQEWLER